MTHARRGLRGAILTEKTDYFSAWWSIARSNGFAWIRKIREIRVADGQRTSPYQRLTRYSAAPAQYH